jgi:hypothetical protein|tara:strand:+ start:793 stop:1227 length:435 start_codon:yes stop_codon:yes gene_type:complete
MISLEKIQSMWQEDCKIDIDNMHEESIKIPQLHSKYHEMLNNLILLRTNAQKIQKSVRHQRYEYYSGKADPEVYEKEPFPKKVRDKDALIRYMDADERLTEANLKVEYYNVMINYIESILKQISNRTYQIKNSIEWHKFQAGFT